MRVMSKYINAAANESFHPTLRRESGAWINVGFAIAIIREAVRSLTRSSRCSRSINLRTHVSNSSTFRNSTSSFDLRLFSSRHRLAANFLHFSDSNGEFEAGL